MGPSGKAIIDYDEFGKKTLDTCSKSVLQGLYVTKNEIKYNDKENGISGACDISNVKLEEVLEVTNVLPNVNGFDQHQACVFNGKKTVKKEDLPYYPHAKRWCIYEALVRLFKDHKKVEEEWRWPSKTKAVFRFTRPYRTRTAKKPARMSAGMTIGTMRRFYGTASRLKLSEKRLKS